MLCTEVFEHADSIEKAMRECVRILKPTGYIIVSTPNYLNIAGLIKYIWELFHPNKSWDAWGNHEDGRENTITSFGLVKLFDNTHIRVKDTRGGDLLRGWFPMFRKYYTFIDRHPMLFLGRLPFVKYFLMNFFILGKNPNSHQ